MSQSSHNGGNGHNKLKRKSGAGRKSSYRIEFAEQAKKLCAIFPATYKHLAEYFGVSTVTIADWRNKHPEFLKAVAEGKGNKDSQVENALFCSAVKGNVHAQIFWLTNRQRDKWCQRQVIAGRIETEDVTPDEFDKASNDDLRKVIGSGGLVLLNRQGGENGKARHNGH